MPTKRQILEALPRPQLQLLATTFEVEVCDRRSKDGLVDGLAAARRAPATDLLAELPVAVLQQLCRTLDLPGGPGQKARLIEHIAGKGRAAQKGKANARAAAKEMGKGRAPTTTWSTKTAAGGKKPAAKTAKTTRRGRATGAKPSWVENGPTRTAKAAGRAGEGIMLETAAVADDDRTRLDIQAPVAVQLAATGHGTDPITPADTKVVRAQGSAPDADTDARSASSPDPVTACEGIGDVADVILPQEDAPGAFRETQDESESKSHTTGAQADVIYLELRQTPTEPQTEASSDESKGEDVLSETRVVVSRTSTGFFARAVGEILGKK